MPLGLGPLFEGDPANRNAMSNAFLPSDEHDVNDRCFFFEKSSFAVDVYYVLAPVDKSIQSALAGRP